MQCAALQMQLRRLRPLALTQRAGRGRHDFHLSRAAAEIDEKDVAPETVCAVDVLDIDNLLWDALFKHSRLDLAVQALEDQRLVCLQVCQVADRSRKQVECDVY